MVAARMPAMITPARTGGSRCCESTTNTFSAPLAVARDASRRKQRTADHTDRYRREQRDHTPYDSDLLDFFQFFFLADSHKTEQNLRNSEVSKAPGKCGNDGQKAIFPGFTKLRHPVYRDLDSLAVRLRRCNTDKA